MSYGSYHNRACQGADTRDRYQHGSARRAYAHHLHRQPGNENLHVGHAEGTLHRDENKNTQDDGLAPGEAESLDKRH